MTVETRRIFSGNGLRLWPWHACLLSNLVQDLAERFPTSLHRVGVVLPTKRLGFYCLAMLAKKLGSFRPPKVFTLERFILHSARDIGHRCEAASELITQLLLSSLIKEKDYRHLHLGHETEMMQFFSELSSMEISFEAFSKIQAIIKNDIFRGEEEVNSLDDRIVEVKCLYEQFLSEISKMKLLLPQDASIACVHALQNHWTSETELPWEHLYFVGFTSVTKAETSLLKTLVTRPNVSIWLSQSPALCQGENPLKDIITALERSSGLTREDQPDVEHSSTPHGSESKTITVYRTPSAISEVRASVNLIKRLFKEGVSPSHIALIVTNENLYGPLVESVLKEEKIEANLAIAIPFSQTVAGSWLEALRSLSLDGETSANILQFFTHPITLFFVSLKIDDPTLDYTFKLTEKLSQIITSTSIPFGAFRGLEDFSEAIEKSSDQDLHLTPFRIVLKEITEKISAWRLAHNVSLDASGEQFTLKDWAEELTSLFSYFEIESFSKSSGGNAAYSYLASVESFLMSLKKATMASTRLTNRRDFWSIIDHHLMTSNVRATGDSLHGVQVLSLREARYVPFKAVLILGCTEGNFPKRLPSDDLIDHFLKARVGLHEPGHLEALEDITFSLLKARIRNLYLFSSKEEFGEPTSPSRFVERILHEDPAKAVEFSEVNEVISEINEVSDIGDRDDTPVTTSISATNANAPLEGEYSGDPDRLVENLSAFQAEKLIRCPYSFLLSKHKLKRVFLPTADDAILEGTLFHSILEAFFTGSTNGKAIVEPLDSPRLNLAEGSLSVFLTRRLCDITDLLIPDELKKSPSHYQLKEFAWPRFANHLAKLTGQNLTREALHQLGSGLREFSFGAKSKKSPPSRSPNNKEPSIELNGKKIFLSGFVDSIDFVRHGDQHLFIITDYKRYFAPPTREVSLGISPQLTFYALSLSQTENSRFPGEFSLKNTLVGYWNIIKGEWNPRAVGTEAREVAAERNLSDLKSKSKSLEEVVASFITTLSWRLGGITAKSIDQSDKSAFNKRCVRFSIDTSHCFGCPYPGLCRKDDPKHREQAKNQTYLRSFLGGVDD